MTLLWLILNRYTILEDFFLLDSVRYCDDVMVTLKFDWYNLKILMSGWYRKLTSSCVSFTTYQQCHSDIEGYVTPISLQYQNVHWAGPIFWGGTVLEHFSKCNFNTFHRRLTMVADIFTQLPHHKKASAALREGT